MGVRSDEWPCEPAKGRHTSHTKIEEKPKITPKSGKPDLKQVDDEIPVQIHHGKAKDDEQQLQLISTNPKERAINSSDPTLNPREKGLNFPDSTLNPGEKGLNLPIPPLTLEKMI